VNAAGHHVPHWVVVLLLLLLLLLCLLVVLVLVVLVIVRLLLVVALVGVGVVVAKVVGGWKHASRKYWRNVFRPQVRTDDRDRHDNSRACQAAHRAHAVAPGGE
jgi:hypothetical protein